jgi:hypothetical protein
VHRQEIHVVEIGEIEQEDQAATLAAVARKLNDIERGDAVGADPAHSPSR